jgi:hypothetical protein
MAQEVRAGKELLRQKEKERRFWNVAFHPDALPPSASAETFAQIR